MGALQRQPNNFDGRPWTKTLEIRTCVMEKGCHVSRNVFIDTKRSDLSLTVARPQYVTGVEAMIMITMEQYKAGITIEQ